MFPEDEAPVPRYENASRSALDPVVLVHEIIALREANKMLRSRALDLRNRLVLDQSETVPDVGVPHPIIGSPGRRP